MERKEMGSDGKPRKRRSSASPSPSKDEDDRSRKQRKSDGRERKSDDRERKSLKDDGREDKKKRDKSEKSHKSREGKEKKSGKKDKSHNKEFQELCEDDYFSKNNEFSTWLKEEKGIYFSDLSSEAARDLFLGFIKKWNSQKLDSQYYEGISSGIRTAHNWNIKP